MLNQSKSISFAKTFANRENFERLRTGHVVHVKMANKSNCEFLLWFFFFVRTKNYAHMRQATGHIRCLLGYCNLCEILKNPTHLSQICAHKSGHSPMARISVDVEFGSLKGKGIDT